MKKGLHPQSREPLKTKALAGSAHPTPLLSDQEHLAQCRQWLKRNSCGEGTPEPRRKDRKNAAGRKVFQCLCLTSYFAVVSLGSFGMSLVL